MTTTQSDDAREPDDGVAEDTGRTRRPTFRSKLRRRVSGMVALTLALISAGALYSALVPEPQTAHASETSALVRQGKSIYENTCISCHGSNLEGVKNRGPSLVGVGGAAVYFQTSTGRMPLARQEAQGARKPAKLTDAEIAALTAYIQAEGGGPPKPNQSAESLAGGDSARGGQLFRLNCASCHNFTGRGGALSSGKFAPSLEESEPDIVYTAMLSGPQNMPKFSDRQLTEEEKKDVIAYVESVRNNGNNVGGESLGGIGPVSEGLIAWIVGIALLIGVTLWIGSRA